VCQDIAGCGIVVPVSLRGMQNVRRYRVSIALTQMQAKRGDPAVGGQRGSQVRRVGLRQGTDCLWLRVFDGRGQGIFPHIDPDRCPFQYIASNQGPTDAGLKLMLQETP